MGLENNTTQPQEELNALITQIQRRPSNFQEVVAVLEELEVLLNDDTDALDKKAKKLKAAMKRAEKILAVALFFPIILVGVLRDNALEISSPLTNLNYLTENINNIPFSIAPFVAFSIIEEMRFAYIVTDDSTDNEYLQCLFMLVDTLFYVLPLLILIVVIVYNIDVETTQVLPYLPKSSILGDNQPGTPDLLDIPAGLSGAALGWWYTRNFRNYYSFKYLQRQHKQLK